MLNFSLCLEDCWKSAVALAQWRSRKAFLYLGKGVWEEGGAWGYLPSNKPHASGFFIWDASNSKTLFCCVASLQILPQPSGKHWGEKHLQC